MMKHKNFLSLLCAAGVVLASVPALPVIAAETAPVSTAAQGTAEEGETADGARWVCTNTGGIGTVGESAGKNGSFTFKWNDTEDARFSIYSVKAKNSGSKDRFTYSGQLDLGDSGYYGISLEPYSFMNVYFVEGWAENSSVRKDAGKRSARSPRKERPTMYTGGKAGSMTKIPFWNTGSFRAPIFMTQQHTAS